MLQRRVRLYAMLISTLWPACSRDQNLVEDKKCSQGLRWVDGDKGGPEMHPGRDCLACHHEKSELDPPALILGGTVYDKPNEPDDCVGVTNAIVRIWRSPYEGDVSKVLELITNGVGNFLLRDDSPQAQALREIEAHRITGGDTDQEGKLPFKATVQFDGRVAQMDKKAKSFSCNGCHTHETGNGDNQPGRIRAEEP
jgi:hypothetical protein